jgi:hypothetical protein
MSWCLQKQKIKLLLLSAKSPFLVGIYDEANELLEQRTLHDAKASDVLPVLIEELLGLYEPTALFYANGPGNQMSIKISFVCLKTLSIVKNIPLKASSSFSFNGFTPIELTNKRFFCFENGNIIVSHIEGLQEALFVLPTKLDETVFGSDHEPVYILPPA